MNEVNNPDILDNRKTVTPLDQGSEKYLEARLKKIVEGPEIEGVCYKFVSPATRSVPDRIVIANGRTYFVEMKSTGQKPTKAQLAEHDKIRVAGGTVVVIDRPSNLKAFTDLLKLLS